MSQVKTNTPAVMEMKTLHYSWDTEGLGDKYFAGTEENKAKFLYLYLHNSLVQGHSDLWEQYHILVRTIAAIDPKKKKQLECGIALLNSSQVSNGMWNNLLHEAQLRLESLEKEGFSQEMQYPAYTITNLKHMLTSFEEQRQRELKSSDQSPEIETKVKTEKKM